VIEQGKGGMVEQSPNGQPLLMFQVSRLHSDLTLIKVFYSVNMVMYAVFAISQSLFSL
jgi:hypothetical protein